MLNKAFYYSGQYHPTIRPPSPPTQRPYRIRTLGEIEGIPFHSTCGTFGEDVMLTVFLSGRGYYHQQGVSIEVGQGMLGIVLPQADPGLLISDREEPYHHYYCRFGGSEALAVAHRIHRAQQGKAFFPYPAWREIRQLFKRMFTYQDPDRHFCYEKQPDGPMRPQEGCLAELLALLEYERPESGKRLQAANLQRYLADRLSEPIDLDEMAADFGVSKSYLCRQAKQELGQSIQKAAEAAKMEWARALLDNGDLNHLSIKEVAQHVGYGDALYFSKVFRRVCGQSPRQWRERQAAQRAKAS